MSALEMFLTQDLPMLAAGVLASLACGIIGCFLVLRRMSLMGDAISHAVLPGIVAGFLFTGTLQAMPIFVGAATVGVLTALFSHLIYRHGRIEAGAAMGVVFTVLFALGVIMLERTHAAGVHLDAECVLYGAMEHALWINPPTTLAAVWSAEHWIDFPRQVTTLAIVLAMNVMFIALFFKELRISAFDPALASSLGYRPQLMHYLLMTFVAISVIAAFEAVGSILVVAMLIVPGVVAHMLTNRLGAMLVVAAIVAIVAAGSGYGAAVVSNLNAAAMIGVMLGVILVIVGVFIPGGWLRCMSAADHRDGRDVATATTHLQQ